MGREAEAPGQDGRLARTVYLDPDPDPGSASAEAAMAALDRQRARLESQLEDLRERKNSMSDAEYQAELETILVQLARIAQKIRTRS